jgi:hypothetical protein
VLVKARGAATRLRASDWRSLGESHAALRTPAAAALAQTNSAALTARPDIRCMGTLSSGIALLFRNNHATEDKSHRLLF